MLRERGKRWGKHSVFLAAFLHDLISGKKPESSCHGVSGPCKPEVSCGIMVW